MLQVSGGWMPGSHLLTEEVSDFSRACVKKGLLTAVPCTGSTSVPPSQVAFVVE